MKRLLLITLVLAMAAVGAFVGCEVESAADQGGNLSISPQSIGLHLDQTVDFTASGGYEYSWSLSEPSRGVLSSTEGATVRYTSRYEPPSNGTAFLQTITVVSTIPSSSSGGSGGTNATTVTSGETTVVSASAIIEHFPGTDSTTNAADAELTITPQSATITGTDAESFAASGGDGSYTWSVSVDGVGSLSNTDGSQSTFTSINPGAGVTNQFLVTVVSGDQDVSASIILIGE